MEVVADNCSPISTKPRKALEVVAGVSISSEFAFCADTVPGLEEYGVVPRLEEYGVVPGLKTVPGLEEYGVVPGLKTVQGLEEYGDVLLDCTSLLVMFWSLGVSVSLTNCKLAVPAECWPLIENG